jgi:TonB-dependent starch-binding outer membrane protein SusC
MTMNCTTFLLLAACLQVSARTQAQISLTEKKAPLEKVLQEIKTQSGYDLVYELDMIRAKSHPVDLQLRNVPLSDALDALFKDQPLTYEIVGKIISIKEKPITKSLIVPAALPPSTDIHGRVTDSLGNPLVGASVTVKGGKRGTETNEKGDFELKGVGENATIVISFSGFESRQLKFGGQSGVTVVLTRSNSQLDQVQVIAYGTTTRRLNTGNVGTVTSEDIEKQPVNNPLLALEGRVPGLFVTQSSGLPGTGVTIRIQGQNSIQNGNDPLYVIDGVPYISQMLPTVTGGTSGILGGSGGTAGSGVGNPLSYLNPNDIESIDVLKDADATAIYGSRAANGAILITTKKGKAGQARVDVNLQNGWGKVTRHINLLNTPQYLQMRHEAKANDNAAIAANDYDINGVWDTTRNTDWQKTLIGGTAKYANLSGSVSGGNATSQYLIGGTYHRESTVFPGDFADQKGSIHFNINGVSPNQKFHIQLTGNYMFDDNLLPNQDLTSSALNLAPDAPALYNPDGTLNWQPNSAGNSTWTNPLSYLLEKYENKTSNLISNAILGYMILPGMELKSSFGYTNMQTNELATIPLVASPPQFLYLGPAERYAYYTNSNNNSWIVEPQINYKKVIAKGRLDALVGTTILQNNSNGQDISGTGYNSDAVLQDMLSAASVTVTSSTAAVYKYNALFGRINYNWSDEFILNLSGRRDGSSRFGAADQFHYFGSVGGAWLFSQEELIKDNLPFISLGKLRGSWGVTGNDQIGNYQFMSLYSPVSEAVPYQNISGLAPNGLPNPYLQWEETKKLQFGVDLSVLRDRIVFTTNYVHNRSSNQLLQYALPIVTGFNGILQNFPATIQNTAWEFMVNTTNIKGKNFTWTSSINLTIPENKLVSFPNLSTSTYASSLIIGKPVGSFMTYHFLGVDPTTGVYQFADSHGNATSSPNYQTDRTAFVNTAPRFYGGLENSFAYKGFRASFLLQFVKQTGGTNDYFGFTSPPGYKSSNQPVSVLKRWQEPGDITDIERYNSNRSLITPYFTAQASDAGFSDASFIRLRNLSLSYTFPDKWGKKTGIRNMRIYVQGQNLLTLTKFHGMDPENQSINSLPPLRVLTAGVQVGL